MSSSLSRKFVIALLVIAALVFAVYFIALPFYADKIARDLNGITDAETYELTPEQQTFHKSLFIVDLHADTLLWHRDASEKSDIGHVDIPRMIEGNAALQAFTAVTQASSSQQLDNNTGRSDDITLLAFAQHWPAKTWFSPKQRALHQAERLHKIKNKSDGQFHLILNSSDLSKFIAARTDDSSLTAGFLGMEGAQVLEGNLEALDELFNAGYRMLGLAHFFDNEVSGSAHGIEKHGLTDLGFEVVKRMDELDMIIDLAHVAPLAIDQTLALTNQAPLVSHTGVKGTCDNQRNLSDDQVRAIAVKGGVIGIGFWDTAVCGTDTAAIVDAIEYVADLVGVDHVALGSDYDGTVTTPFDIAGIGQITGELMQRGRSEEDIRKIMGENSVRLLLEQLPD